MDIKYIISFTHISSHANRVRIHTQSMHTHTEYAYTHRVLTHTDYSPDTRNMPSVERPRSMICPMSEANTMGMSPPSHGREGGRERSREKEEEREEMKKVEEGMRH